MKASWYDLYFVDPQLWFFVTMFLVTLLFVGLCLLEKAWVWAEKTGRLERVKDWAMRVRNGRRVKAVIAFFKEKE